jgi:uncharacterized protein YdeI (YjbR/CyaY-like superfamily)
MEVQTTLLRMPIELVNALASSDKARQFFETLASPHRKAYIEWVGDAPHFAMRKERAKEAIKMLEAGNKSIAV